MYKDVQDHIKYNTKWNKDNKEKRALILLKYDLKYRYGLTVDDFNLMFESQKGCCKICGIHQSKLKYRLHVDHDHKTGKIRSLLCKNCNTMLGRVDDSVEILNNMISYINDWSE